MLVSILGSLFAGSATGLLGVLFQRFFDFLHEREVLKQKQADQLFELEKRKIDIQITTAEWNGRVKVAATEADAAKDVAESGAFAASQFKEPDRYAQGEAPKNWLGTSGWFLLVLLDVLRGSVRPGLTLYLAWITTAIYNEAKIVVDAHGLMLTPEQALELLNNIVATILYLFTTCVLWYFGTRNRQKPPVLKRG